MTPDSTVEGVTLYKVVINHEEQYSIWLIDRDSPPGWYDVGKTGSKEDCLDYISTAWTDMRPLSLRKQMAEAKEERRSDNQAEQPFKAPEKQKSLVERLC